MNAPAPTPGGFLRGYPYEIAPPEFQVLFPDAREDGLIFPLPQGAQTHFPEEPGRVVWSRDVPAKPNPDGNPDLDIPALTVVYYGARRPARLWAWWHCLLRGHQWVDRSIPAANLTVRRCVCCLRAELDPGEGQWQRMPKAAYAKCQEIQRQVIRMQVQPPPAALLPSASSESV